MGLLDRIAYASNVPDKVIGAAGDTHHDTMCMKLDAIIDGDYPVELNEFLGRARDKNASLKIKSDGRFKVFGDVESALRYFAVDRFIESGVHVGGLRTFLGRVNEHLGKVRPKPISIGMVPDVVEFIEGPLNLGERIVYTKNGGGNARDVLRAELDSSMLSIDTIASFLVFLGPAKDKGAFVKLKGITASGDRDAKVVGDVESALRHFAVKQFLRFGLRETDRVGYIGQADQIIERVRGDLNATGIREVNDIIDIASRRLWR